MPNRHQHPLREYRSPSRTVQPNAGTLTGLFVRSVPFGPRFADQTSLPSPISVPAPQPTAELADLAYNGLATNAPALLEYLVGFQSIDASEDETTSTSVFGFNIHGRWYYSPVFFFNGQIKGQEILISATPKMLIPLSEEWVQQIVTEKQTDLGAPDEENKSDVLRELPNLRYLVGRGSLYGQNTKAASGMRQLQMGTSTGKSSDSAILLGEDASPADYVEGEVRGRTIDGTKFASKGFDLTPFLQVLDEQGQTDLAKASNVVRETVPDATAVLGNKEARDCLAVTMEEDPELLPAMLKHYTEEELVGA